MSFSRACESGQSLTIAAVGDVLPHEGLAEQAYASFIGFESLWVKVVPYLKAADMAYANVEGPVGNAFVVIEKGAASFHPATEFPPMRP